jgi:hypothetical protein
MLGTAMTPLKVVKACWTDSVCRRKEVSDKARGAVAGELITKIKVGSAEKPKNFSVF